MPLCSTVVVSHGIHSLLRCLEKKHKLIVGTMILVRTTEGGIWTEDMKTPDLSNTVVETEPRSNLHMSQAGPQARRPEILRRYIGLETGGLVGEQPGNQSVSIIVEL